MLKQFSAIGAFCVICIATPALAAPDAATFRRQLDGFIEAQMKAQKVPGVAVAVLQKGDIIVSKGYGKASVELDAPVTTDTIFQSGSVGKMFTATAIMLAVEEGKIALDDPVGKYLPNAPESWNAITIRHLLSHTSGIPDYYGTVYDFRHDYTDDDLIRMAYGLKLDFKPGSRWSYSNTAYVLLGIIVKKVTGKSYLEFLDERVFKPVGMRTTRGINDRDIVPNRAAGYQLINGELKNQDWVSMANPTADGSLFFTIKDMIEWARAVEQGTVLSSTSWKEVYTPIRLNSGKTYPYGFGWGVTQVAGHPRYAHAGAWQGFRTYYSRYLGDDLSVILLTNSADTKLNTFMDGIAGLWDPALVAPGPRPKPMPAIDQRVRAMIERARSGTLREQDLPMAIPGTVEALNEAVAPAFKTIGPLTKLELTDRSEVGDDTVYSYDAAFGEQNFTVKLNIAPGDRVSNFRIMN